LYPPCLLMFLLPTGAEREKILADHVDLDMRMQVCVLRKEIKFFTTNPTPHMQADRVLPSPQELCLGCLRHWPWVAKYNRVGMAVATVAACAGQD